MAISFKPRTGAFKPIGRVTSAEFKTIVDDCKNPPRASASLKARIAAAKVSAKVRVPA